MIDSNPMGSRSAYLHIGGLVVVVVERGNMCGEHGVLHEQAKLEPGCKGAGLVGALGGGLNEEQPCSCHPKDPRPKM